MSPYNSISQSKWSHGFSVGLVLSDFVENQQSVNGSDRYTFEPLFKSSFEIWNQYRLSDRLSVNLSPGFGWKGARLNAEQVDYEGVYFVLPSYVEVQLIDYVALGAGIEYSYLISLGESSDLEAYNLTSQVSSRHLLASIANLRIILTRNVSINVEYNYGINDFFQFSRFNTMGGFRENINLKNKGVQISFTFHT